jgi:UDP-N-acetylenolpyruvoylglucosamine reductase
MKQSLAKGGWFSLSLKVNFLYGIVSRNKDTINNIEFEDLRFAYRDSFLSYNLYVYDYFA